MDGVSGGDAGERDEGSEGGDAAVAGDDGSGGIIAGCVGGE